MDVMKKVLIVLGVVVLIAASVSITVYALVNSDAEAPVEEAKPETPAVVEEYWAEYKAKTGKTTVSLSDIYFSAKQLCEENKQVSIKPGFANSFMIKWSYAEHEPVCKQYIARQERILLDFTEKPADERDVYLVFISSLESCFADNCYYYDENYGPTYNRLMITFFAYVEDPSVYGKTTAKEVITAYRAKEITPEDLVAYNVYFAPKPMINSVVNDPSLAATDWPNYYEVLAKGEKFD